MLPIKVPVWWDSVRAILALGLTGSYCFCVIAKVPDTSITGLKELTMLALTFYFALKKRDEGGKPQ